MSNNIDSERVIDDLTEGLEKLLTTKPPQGPSSDLTPESGVEIADPTDTSIFGSSDQTALPTSHSTKHDASSATHREFDEYHAEKSDDDDADDNDIVEELLKDAELDLTEDQKEERKIIADELKKAGNDAFKNGEYELSISKYTDGLNTCPLEHRKDRAVLYCNRSAAKMKMKKYKQAIADCTKAIELDSVYVKAYIRRAQSYESTEKLDEALADFKKILELEPSNDISKKAVSRLPSLIEERNEKLKNEMMGKLKELGNMILKPFGLSTDNFQVNQDSESKGYSINFKQ